MFTFQHRNLFGLLRIRGSGGGGPVAHGLRRPAAAAGVQVDQVGLFRSQGGGGVAVSLLGAIIGLLAGLWKRNISLYDIQKNSYSLKIKLWTNVQK